MGLEMMLGGQSAGSGRRKGCNFDSELGAKEEHHQPAQFAVLLLVFFGNGYSIGFSPNMLVNWYANKSGNMVSFPIGLSLSKVQRLGILPVRFALQGQYMPVHPDAFGQKWNIQVVIAPVIPKLIKGNVLE